MPQNNDLTEQFLSTLSAVSSQHHLTAGTGPRQTDVASLDDANRVIRMLRREIRSLEKQLGAANSRALRASVDGPNTDDTVKAKCVA